MSSYAKRIVNAQSKKPLIANRSLVASKSIVSKKLPSASRTLVAAKIPSNGLPPQPMTKQAFLNLKQTVKTSPKFIHPETAWAEVIVEASDIDASDIVYNFDTIYSDITFDVPAGYARHFTIYLYDSDFYAVGYVEFDADVIVNPTYIIAAVVPVTTDDMPASSFNSGGTTPTPSPVGGNPASYFHAIKFDFNIQSTSFTAPGKTGYIYVNPTNFPFAFDFNDYITGWGFDYDWVGVFDQYGEELTLGFDYTISPVYTLTDFKFTAYDPFTYSPYYYSTVYLVFNDLVLPLIYYGNGIQYYSN